MFEVRKSNRFVVYDSASPRDQRDRARDLPLLGKLEIEVLEITRVNKG